MLRCQRLARQQGSKKHSQLRLFPFAVFEIICVAPSRRTLTATHVVSTAAHLALDTLEQQLPTRVAEGRREKRLAHLCKPKDKSQLMKETSDPLSRHLHWMKLVPRTAHTKHVTYSSAIYTVPLWDLDLWDCVTLECTLQSVINNHNNYTHNGSHEALIRNSIDLLYSLQFIYHTCHLICWVQHIHHLIS